MSLPLSYAGDFRAIPGGHLLGILLWFGKWQRIYPRVAATAFPRARKWRPRSWCWNCLDKMEMAWGWVVLRPVGPFRDQACSIEHGERTCSEPCFWKSSKRTFTEQKPTRPRWVRYRYLSHSHVRSRYSWPWIISQRNRPQFAVEKKSCSWSGPWPRLNFGSMIYHLKSCEHVQLMFF